MSVDKPGGRGPDPADLPADLPDADGEGTATAPAGASPTEPAPLATTPGSEAAEQEPPYTDPDRNWVNQELELLISAAIVFSLFQLPGVLDAAFSRLDLHVGPDLHFFTFMPYYVAKLLVYGLIATFLVHFLLRSLWVALLGLQTAFPAGIQWDRLKLGPVALELYRDDLPTVEALEERVDRLASSLFAFLFVFVTLMFIMTLWSLLLGLVAYLLARVFWPADANHMTGVLFMVLMGAFTLTTALTAGIDRALGGKYAHLVPGWARKAVLRVYKALRRTGPNDLYMPIFFTLSSSGSVSRTKLNVILVAFVYGLIGLFFVAMMVDRGVLRMDSYTYYPDSTEEWGMSATHYDSLRPEGRSVSLPSLSSDVARGPYLRLFVPYDAAEDNDRIEELCPDLRPLHSDGLRLRQRDAPEAAHFRAILGCLDRLYRVSLDGETLDDLEWMFYTHPQGGVRGWLTYLPTAEMEPGRHMLVVEHVPLPRPEGADQGTDGLTEGAAAEETADEDDEHDSSRDTHHLPFWV